MYKHFVIDIAELAQLVEQRIRNAWVGGSSPPFGSINDMNNYMKIVMQLYTHCAYEASEYTKCTANLD